MPLPPKGDPQRPLQLAVRSTRILGILFLALGLLGTVPMLFIRRAPAAMPGWYMAVIVASTALFYFVPGSVYLICAVFLARLRTWAVITAIVMAGMHLLFIAASFVGLIFVAFQQPSTVAWILLGVVALLAVALAQLEFHLSKCFEAIRQAPLDAQRGFEPLPAMPVVAATAPGDPHADPLPR